MEMLIKKVNFSRKFSVGGGEMKDPISPTVTVVPRNGIRGVSVISPCLRTWGDGLSMLILNGVRDHHSVRIDNETR